MLRKMAPQRSLVMSLRRRIRKNSGSGRECHWRRPVSDGVKVTQSGAESRFYTVKSGDTLSAISKAMYGSANDYQRIFEANKPMLTHPDKIYPGQVLIIPAK